MQNSPLTIFPRSSLTHEQVIDTEKFLRVREGTGNADRSVV